MEIPNQSKELLGDRSPSLPSILLVFSLRVFPFFVLCLSPTHPHQLTEGKLVHRTAEEQKPV